MDRCQKCRSIDSYWNAIGNSKVSYYNRKVILTSLFLGAIPIAGQVAFIWILIYTYFQARRTDAKAGILKEFNVEYIKKLVEKDKNKKKNRRTKK